jgi:tRNA nucleotidyltransferase (CCA-adding enzyme)
MTAAADASFDEVVATERASLGEAARVLMEDAYEVIERLDVDADVVQVGSTARGTWTAGDRDIDIFVRFPPELDRAELERFGLEIGNAVLPDGHEEYAEHPYVQGEFRGYAVDLVPCYQVDSAGSIQSSVDRTPFHTEYVEYHLTESLAADVRLLKQFLKGIGVYGSDLRTQGFSGYLTELLVIEYGGFRETLEAASRWRPPVELDPEDHGTTEFDDPLVVIDPTDADRNVAAVVTGGNVARLQHHARAFLDAPSVARFFPDPPTPLDAAGISEQLTARETTALAVVFDAPDLVEDQLYPQLHRSRDGLVRGLEAAEFHVLRASTWADERAVLFVELTVADLPAVERHVGPPVHVEEHAREFYEKYADRDGANDAVYGPFVDEDGRYVVEREREVTSAVEFARERLLDVALGTHVESALHRGFEVRVDEEIASLADEFGTQFAAYFDPTP